MMFHKKRAENIEHFEPTHMLTGKPECVCIILCSVVDRYMCMSFCKKVIMQSDYLRELILESRSHNR